MRKIMVKWLASEEVIIVVLSLVLLGFSYGPLLYQYLTPPAGKVFWGNFGFPADFLANVMVYQEGRLGHWQTTLKYTSTLNFQPAWNKTIYIFLGQASRMFPFVDQILFLHLVRLVTSMILLIVAYVLISKIFKQKYLRIVAFLLALFSTGWPGGEKFLDLWSPISIFLRMAYYPHYLISFVLVLLAMFWLVQALDERNLAKAVGAGILGFWVALFHPPAILAAYLALPLYLILFTAKLLNSKKVGWGKILVEEVKFLGIFVLLSFWPLYYLANISSSYPWNVISKYDTLYDLANWINLKEFLLGIGPMAVLGLVGTYWAFKKGGRWNLMLAPWAITYIVGFFFLGKVIGYNGVRFLQTPFFVVLAIMSTYTIDEVSGWMAEKWRVVQKEKLVYCLALVTLLPSLGIYSFSIKENLQEKFNQIYSSYVYLSRERLAAFEWLSRNSREDEVVLSSEANGTLILSLVGNYPYISMGAGQFEESFSEINRKAIWFFEQSGGEQEVGEFIKENKIKLIFWGTEERVMAAGRELNYSFLKPVYSNAETVIYKVE